MKLPKAQLMLIGEINSMYDTNSEANKRLRLLGAAMVTIHDKPIEDYGNPYNQQCIKYARDAIVVAGVILMNQLPPYDDKSLDGDTNYVERVTHLLEYVVTMLYKELKLAENALGHNLLLSYIAEIGAFCDIAVLTVKPTF